MNKKVFAIIVTYNGMKWIEKCLSSMINSTYPIEVIVIDNSSKDGTLDFIRSNFPSVRILENNQNLGFGKANNVGIAYALDKGADFVFLLNQDVYIEEDTVTKLLAADFDGIGVLSPVHLNGTGSSLDSNFAYYVSSNKDFLFGVLRKKSINKRCEFPFINAAAWFVPANTFRMIGGFDPIFAHYGEDNNFCHRLRYHGLKICVEPTAFIMHDRLVFGNEKTFKKDGFYRVSLMDLCDISKPVTLKSYLKANVKLLLRTEIRFMSPFYFIKDQIRVLFSHKRIKESKQMNMKKGPNYL
ncbi:MAG: glycosyltransferase family 2 protein [Bacteroidales bacterium]